VPVVGRFGDADVIMYVKCARHDITKIIILERKVHLKIHTHTHMYI
jgi:hypothetical protein